MLRSGQAGLRPWGRNGHFSSLAASHRSNSRPAHDDVAQDDKESIVGVGTRRAALRSPKSTARRRPERCDMT